MSYVMPWLFQILDKEYASVTGFIFLSIIGGSSIIAEIRIMITKILFL
jgi:hypothetical protein